VTGRKTSGKIQGDQPDEKIDGYGGKDFEKKKVVRRHGKRQQAV